MAVQIYGDEIDTEYARRIRHRGWKRKDRQVEELPHPKKYSLYIPRIKLGKRSRVPNSSPLALPELDSRVKTRLLTLPGSNYIGPLNPLDGAPARSEIDYAAYLHDIDPDFEYFRHNAADERFMQRLQTAAGPRWQKTLALAWHKFKKATFPHSDRNYRQTKISDFFGSNKYGRSIPLGRRKAIIKEIQKAREENMEVDNQVITTNSRLGAITDMPYIKGVNNSIGKVFTKYSKNAVHVQGEFQKTLSAADCQYFGHCAVQSDNLLDSCCQALIKSLFAQVSIHVADMDEPIPWGCKLIVQYSPGTTTQSSDEYPGSTFQTVDLVVPNSFKDAAISLRGLFEGGVDKEKRHWQRMSLNREDSLGYFAQEALIELSTVIFYFKAKSILKFQNTTKAGGTNEQLINDISAIKANPIVVSEYYNSKWNGFMYRYRVTHSPELTKNLVCHPTYQFFDIVSWDEDSSKPLPGFAFHLKNKATKFNMMPASIRRSVLSRKFGITLQKLFSILADDMHGGSNRRNYPLGPARMFAAEHVIKVTNDPNIEFAVQIDNYMSCVATYTNKVYTKPQITKIVGEMSTATIAPS